MAVAERIKIGASDVAAALGVCPFKTTAELAAELLGRVEPKPVNQAACDIGNRIERFVGYEYEIRTGAKLIQSRSRREDLGFVHPEREWLEVHPDFESSDRIVECKTVGPRMAFNWGNDGDPDGVPYYVLAQVVTQIACHPTLNRADVAAYFGGGDFRIFPVEPDQDTIGAVLERLDRFMSGVLKGEMPFLTGDDGDLVKRLYRIGGGDPVEASERVLRLVDEYKLMKSGYDTYKEALQVSVVGIKEFMEEHDVLTIEGKPVFTWKKTKAGTRMFLSKIKDKPNGE